MKTTFTLFAMLLLSTGLFAQKFIQEWYVQIPAFTYMAEATAIITTPDNNLLVTGPVKSLTRYNGSMFYLKVDTAGNAIWLTHAEEQFDNRFQRAYRLKKDNEGNFVMIGTYPHVYDHITYFTKISPSGDILNTTVNGGQGTYQGGYDIEQTADSGFLVAAYDDNYWNGPSLAVRKLDNEGRFIWDTTFVDADTNLIGGRFYAMDRVDDTTFVLTGIRDYIPGSAEDFDIFFAKIRVYDDSVKMLNLKVYEGEYNDRGYDIMTLPGEQGFIICGKGPNENNTMVTQGILMRIDTAGNTVWKKTFARSLNSNTIFGRVHLNADNDIVVLANAANSVGNSETALLKYSLNGDLLQKTYFNYTAGDQRVTPYDFTIAQDGKIYVAASNMVQGNGYALLLKVKDGCPLHAPEVSLENEQPVLGEDVTVHVQNTNDAWQYNLLQINGDKNLGTYMGNGETLDFTATGLNNEDVADGLAVSVIEPGVDCIKYSDTLFPEFICPVETPVVSLVNPTPALGEDLVVRVLNTNDALQYKLIQVNDEVLLGTATGNGGTYDFSIPGLTNDDVSAGVFVTVMLPGFSECAATSDTLFPRFIDGIEESCQRSLQITPNPFRDYLIITDALHTLSTITVYNTAGKQMTIKKLQPVNNKIILPELPTGLYIIKVTYQNGVSLFRKVLKH